MKHNKLTMKLIKRSGYLSWSVDVFLSTSTSKCRQRDRLKVSMRPPFTINNIINTMKYVGELRRGEEIKERIYLVFFSFVRFVVVEKGKNKKDKSCVRAKCNEEIRLFQQVVVCYNNIGAHDIDLSISTCIFF